MISEGIKVLLPARHGLGDVLSAYFIAPRGRAILARVRHGLESGVITSALLVYEDSYNPSIGELFRALPFNVTVKPTSDLWEIQDQDSDNRMPHAVRWHQNIFTNPPGDFEKLDARGLVDCPTSAPLADLPEDFILFSDAASAPDRVLTDPDIYSFLRAVTALPIIKVGQFHDIVPADINLSNRLNIIETLFLAKHARLIVSALTMFRTCAALFGTPVIELSEHASAATISRTQWEYDRRLYGMQAPLNHWFFWPSERSSIRDRITKFLGAL